MLERAFGNLLEQQPSGNVLFSPHAATLALMQQLKHATGTYRAAVLQALGPGVTLAALERDLEQAERRLKGPPLPELPEVGQGAEPHFDFESASFDPASELQPPAGARHVFVGRALAQAANGSAPQAVVTVDAILAGVPWSTPSRAEIASFAGLATPFAHYPSGASFGCTAEVESAGWPAEQLGSDNVPPKVPKGRAYVAFALPKQQLASVTDLPALPCGGGALATGGAEVELDFRAPAFCAVGKIELGRALGLPKSQPPVRVATRMSFDARGTFNGPPRALPSPESELDAAGRANKRAISFDRPFFVTVHDRETGAIIYVAWIREPGVAAACH